MIPAIESMKGAFSLEGKNAIITGGNRGLGAAIAEAFAQSGANTAIFCRDQGKAADEIVALEKMGGKHRAFSCDVTSLDSVKKAVGEAYDVFGTIDILVNNAGVSATGELLDMDDDLSMWTNVIEVDLNGTARMTFVVGRRMRDDGKGGCIINVTSNAGFMVNHGQPMSWYSTAKAGANHFTHCMACELGKYDIRVNGIAPGFTNTELSRHIPKDDFSYINEQTVTGRFGEPIEVGALAVYLASPAAAQVTGHVAVIDGGYMLRC